MATALSTLITECRNELIDTGGSPRWTNAEFLEYANACMREIARLKPEEVSTLASLSLADGAYQTLPNTYDALIELVSNADGVTIREVEYAALKSSLTFAQTTGEPREFARMSANQFAVYPAVTGGGTTVTALVVDPPSYTTVNDNLDLSDAALQAVVHYMIYRARSKDAEDTVMAARAIDAYNKFRMLLGGDGGTNSAQ